MISFLFVVRLRSGSNMRTDPPLMPNTKKAFWTPLPKSILRPKRLRHIEHGLNDDAKWRLWPFSARDHRDLARSAAIHASAANEQRSRNNGLHPIKTGFPC